MNPDPVIPLEWTPDSCQRWRGGRARWVRSSTFNPALYRVAPISAADARHFVIQHHYSATMPAAIHHHGLIHTPTEQLVGVAVASVPVSRRTLTNAAQAMADAATQQADALRSRLTRSEAQLEDRQAEADRLREEVRELRARLDQERTRADRAEARAEALAELHQTADTTGKMNTTTSEKDA